MSTLVIGRSGDTMLIDTGHYQDDGEHVLQYLRSHGIDHLDSLVVTHADADHIGDNAAIIEYFETEAQGIGAIYDPGIAASMQTYEQYLNTVEQYNVTLYETPEGDRIPFEGVNVSVLGPPEPYLEDGARNENSIVLKLGYEYTNFLFTGDAEDDQEQYIVEKYGDRLNATVLKAGHHGSASSASGSLLDAVSPKLVVISSAYDSQYGHPSEEVLNRLESRSIPTYWTATHGNIVLMSNGSQVEVKTQAEAPTDPSRLRDGEPITPGNTTTVQTRAIVTGEGWTPVGATSAGTATPVATETPAGTSTETVETDGGTAPGDLILSRVHAVAAGDEYENLNDEYLVFENTGDSTLDLSGWSVTDLASHSYTFPDGTTLESVASITLHTGEGSDSETDLYWGSDAPVWNNGGDTVTVRNTNGEVVLEEEYE